MDAEAAFDLAPALAALETRLASDRGLRALPAKFSFALDAGGRLSVPDLEADIRFEAVRAAGSPSFVVRLAGGASLAALCAEADIGEAAARLARAFLALTGAGFPALPARRESEGARGEAAGHDGAKSPGPSSRSSPCEEGEGTLASAGVRRMRALVEQIGAKAIFAEACLPAALLPLPACADGEGARTPAGARLPLGALVFGAATAVGVAAPFGATDARRLAALVARAREAGADGLRLTPWRAFFVVGLAREAAAAFAQDCASLGFILDPGDPRLRVVACPGAPACAHAQAPLHGDAARWAALLPEGEGVALHLSGCAKGCAHSQSTALTLVATGRGYDVVVNGRARDIPVRRNLPPFAVEALIASGEPFFARSAE
jgi:precorrin-3B synthase